MLLQYTAVSFIIVIHVHLYFVITIPSQPKAAIFFAPFMFACFFLTFSPFCNCLCHKFHVSTSVGLHAMTIVTYAAQAGCNGLCTRVFHAHVLGRTRLQKHAGNRKVGLLLVLSYCNCPRFLEFNKKHFGHLGATCHICRIQLETLSLKLTKNGCCCPNSAAARIGSGEAGYALPAGFATSTA